MARPLAPLAALSPALTGLAPSATIAINARSKALAAAGRTIYRLGLGQSPFPVPAHVQAALRAAAHEKDYLPTRGLPALRRAVVDRLRRLEGVDRDPDAVQIGPGTKELMYALQVALDAELILPSPSWVSYAPQARIAGRPVRWLPARAETGLAVEPDAIDALLADAAPRTRLFILNAPGNPTGRGYSATELEGIAAALRRHRVLALSDEIYSGTRFDGEHVSLARSYPEGTIVSDGLSKWCGAGGWRLGWFSLPPGLEAVGDALAAMASETFTSVSAPVQYAAVPALGEHPEMERYLDDSRRILARLLGDATMRLRAAGATLPTAHGGFYLFPDFEALRPKLAHRGIHDGPGLCAALLEATGVAVLPGSCFGRATAELSLRMALVDFDGGAALTAARGHTVDAAFTARHCTPVVEAVDRMVRFIAG